MAAATQQKKYEQFQISGTVPIADELRRVGHGEIDFAVTHAQLAKTQPTLAVHECRKAVKRLRALARLAVDVDVWSSRKIDRRLRNAGRLFSKARDAEVLVQTLEALKGQSEAFVAIDTADTFLHPDSDLAALASKFVRKLKKLRPRINKLVEAANEWTLPSLLQRIAIGYGTAATAKVKFLERGSQTALHDWRKAVQCHTNQLHLVANVTPDHVQERLFELGDLSGLLGQYHDLTILRTALKSKHHTLNKTTKRALVRVAKKSQSEFREDALKIGGSLFSLTSEEFHNSLISPANNIGKRQRV